MGEFMNAPRDPKDDLVTAIEAGSGATLIGNILETCEGGLSETVIKAAEHTGNPEVIAAVLDYVLCNGLELDHPYPTQIHWAIGAGLPLSAKFLAEIITDGDLAERYQGMTPKQFASKKGMPEVANMLT